MSCYISVIYITSRVGGIDILFDSLSRQTFQNFEVIIVDGIYEHRKNIIKEKEEIYSFPIKHISPFNNQFPLNAYCRAANTGLSYVNGQIVLFLCDYTFLPPESLQRHAQFHMKNQNQVCMGCHRYFKLQNVHPDFEPYLNEPDEQKKDPLIYNHTEDDALKYADDVKSGKYNHLMYSLFTEDFNFDKYELEWDPILAVADPKALIKESTYVQGNLLHLKNESIPLKNLLAVNGLGEAYLDGAHSMQDTDLADRLEKFGGIIGWYLEKDLGCYLFNPRTIFPHSSRTRSVLDNRKIWEQERDAGYPTKNKWSVKEMNRLIKMKNMINATINEMDFK